MRQGEHGTESTYQRCLREYGNACDACVEAHTSARRGRANFNRPSMGGKAGRLAREMGLYEKPKNYAEGQTLEELLDGW